MTKKNTTTPYPTPRWIIELQQRYSAAVKHAFVLHFNVDDLVVPGLTLAQYIPQAMATINPAVVVFYDRAHGLSFPLESMKKTFTAAVTDTAAAPNPLAQMAGRAPKEGELPTAPSDVLPLLDKLLKKDMEQPVIVVLNWADAIVPNAPFTQLSAEDRTNVIMVSDWGTDKRIAALGNMVILTARNLGDLNQQVVSPSSGYQQILVDLPSQPQRMSYVESVYSAQAEAFEWKLTPAEIARLTTTLGLRDLKHLFLEASFNGKMDKDLLNRVKAEIISAEYGDLVQIVDPSMTFADIGDLDHIKKWMSLNVIQPLRNGDSKNCPMGVLFTGPPGTGKTAMAEAVAGEAGVIMLNIQMSKVFGKYVGDSERNMARMLRMAVSASPCILWLDEIDQGISRGEGDSGASNRVFQQLLQFMSNKTNRGRIVVMAATNRPDLMDAALKRPGRFDAKIPFLVPNETGRKAIFTVMCKRYEVPASDQDISFAAARTDGYTGAEIETLAIKAAQLINQMKMAPTQAMEAAITRIRRTTSAIASMTALALAECNDTDLLPPGYAVPTQTQLDESIAELPERARPKF